ncbi:Pentatricopeptide repeat-containing protein 2, mitochondrial [Halotydeus destructor]|nr:Pentatricopeptide repeat-containing protein 2, mitochondrial [Halotydeus destructor]
MAGLINNLIRCSSASLAKSSFSAFKFRKCSPPVFLWSARSLYSDSFVGLEFYRENKKKVEDQFGHMREKFFERMRQHITDDSVQSMVFTEDLKNVTFLITDSPEDLELLVTMLKKFNSQNRDLRFGSFVFGPVIMRSLYTFRKWEAALALLKDEKCNGFFDQISSYLIVMNLLYKEKQYSRVLELFDLFQDAGVFEQRFPRDLVVLALASCYHIGTPEAFEIANGIVKKARIAGSPISKRGVAFYAALCLKNSNPQLAMEALSLTFPLGPKKPINLDPIAIPHSIVIENLKPIALARMGRVEDSLLGLRAILNNDSPRRVSKVLPEVVAEVKDAVAKSGQQELLQEFEHTEKMLSRAGLILNKTIDELLDLPIEGRRNEEVRSGRDNRTYSRPGRQLPPPRRGLIDAED